MITLPDNRGNLAERFLRFVSPEPNSGCWLWTGSSAGIGYGSFSVSGKMRGAHQVSYALFNGPIPDGLHVCHRCDVRFCVNPEHLFCASNAENIADKVRKKRQVAGTRVNTAKLSDADARQAVYLRSIGWTFRRIAAGLGLKSHRSVVRICHGKTGFKVN